MGRVKLTVRPLYHLHGTAEEESLGTAASHGCVRLSNPDVVELARLIHRCASPQVPEATLDRLEAEPWHPRTIALAAPVPLRIVYEPVEVRDGRLEVHPDVYGRVGGPARAHALRVLREKGATEEAVDREAPDRLLEQGRRESVALPLEELLRPPGEIDPAIPYAESRLALRRNFRDAASLRPGGPRRDPSAAGLPACDRGKGSAVAAVAVPSAPRRPFRWRKP